MMESVPSMRIFPVLLQVNLELCKKDKELTHLVFSSVALSLFLSLSFSRDLNVVFHAEIFRNNYLHK